MIQNQDLGRSIFQIVLTLISSGVVGVFLKNHFDNKLNKSNHDHEEEMNKLKAKLESDTFISNKQYEKEFEIYQELWGNQIDCYSYYVDSVNCFLRAIENYITNGKADLDKLENNLKEIEKTN